MGLRPGFAWRGQHIRVAVAALLFVIVTAATAYWTATGVPRARQSAAPGSADALDGRLTVLVVGADKRTNDLGRTDTILLVSVDPEEPSVGVLSIPRDTYAEIPGRSTPEKVNAAYTYGGVELTAQTLERLLGIPVQYYVEMDFSGFIRMIDAIGGVDITVEKPLKYEDHSQQLFIDIPAGEQHLNGEQSLHYVRFRADGLGDVSLVDERNIEYDGRIPRQEKFMRALVERALEPSTLLRVPELIGVARDSIRTNLSLALMTRLAMLARTIDLSNVEMGVLPGIGRTIDGAAYWVPDPPQVDRVVRELVLGSPRVPVTVLNGNGERGLALEVAERVRDIGLYVRSMGNAATFDEPFTRVVAPESARETAERIARLVGGVALVNEQSTSEGITVVIGKDYAPAGGG